MLDNNFIDEQFPQYHSHNLVYTHESGNSLYLGDASSATDPTFLSQSHITLVVTAATNMEQLRFGDGIEHVVYGLLDAKTENVMGLFGGFFQLVQRAILKGNILVHCFAGVSRSATLVISYVMKKNKWGFKDAIAEIRKYRPSVLPNLGFERQLKQYEKTLKMQELSITRKMISKTSQSRKHQTKKLTQIALPQIFALGKTLGRPKNLDPPPIIQPSSQMQSRKMRLANLQQFSLGLGNGIHNSAHGHGNGYGNGYGLGRNQIEKQGNFYEPLSNRLPIRNFRKRSISISRKVPKIMVGSDPQVQLVRLPPHKLAINEIRFDTEKVIRNVMHKEFYNNN